MSTRYLVWYRHIKTPNREIGIQAVPLGPSLSLVRGTTVSIEVEGMLFFRHYFSPLNTFMRKGKDPDPYLCLMDSDSDPGGPKT